MRPLIAGNWKMHGTAAALTEVEALAAHVAASRPSADLLICPPATLISRAVAAAGGRITIGGQDCHTEPSGAFTGDISAEMLKDAGCTAVIVGHSERRQYHGETNAQVAAKAAAAQRAGLTPIICVGESEADRDHGKPLSIVAAQIAGSLPKRAPDAVIAYEPIWAIGTGRTPTIAQIGQMHAHIRSCLKTTLGTAGASIRILYGGSVKPANAGEILAVSEVAGALVGGASLKADDFIEIFSAVPAAA